MNNYSCLPIIWYSYYSKHGNRLLSSFCIILPLSLSPSTEQSCESVAFASPKAPFLDSYCEWKNLQSELRYSLGRSCLNSQIRACSFFTWGGPGLASFCTWIKNRANITRIYLGSYCFFCTASDSIDTFFLVCRIFWGGSTYSNKLTLTLDWSFNWFVNKLTLITSSSLMLVEASGNLY